MTLRLGSWIAPAFVLAFFVASGFLWLNASDSSKEADLGANAIAGSIVALAILLLERSLNRLQERQQQVALLATSSVVRGIALPGADLHAAYAVAKDLSYCVLSKANLRDARLHDAKCSWGDFSDADLRGADIRWADLSQANLANADLRSADLGATSLSGADLSDADLRGAKLFARRRTYQGANMSGAALFGADLRDVALGVRDRKPDHHVVGVVLRDAWANEETRWPSGFNPAAAGVKLLPGKRRREHDYYVAFKDPGFEDVTVTTEPGEWETSTYSPHDRYPHGYQWHVLSEALMTMESELEAIRLALTNDADRGNSEAHAD